MTFGEILKKLRIEKGINGPELAKLLNVTKQTVSNWENDNRVPSKEIIVKIADIFSTSTDYLLGNTDIKNEKYMIDAIKKVLIEKGFTGKPEEMPELRAFLSGAVDLYNLNKKKKS